MLDAKLSVLADSHRRRLLSILAQTPAADEPIATSRAVRTDRENFSDGDGKHPESIKLYHVHLPKLADHGYVDWNREAQTVARGPQFENIVPLLTALNEMQDVLSEGSVPD